MTEEKIKIIKGLNDLIIYLKSIGLCVTRQTAIKYIDAGLPHWKFNNTYHFHVNHINDFFLNACSLSKEAQEHLNSK